MTLHRFWLVLLLAAATGFLLEKTILAADVGVAAGGVDIQADRLEYDAGRKILVGVGNVVVTDSGDELRADYIEVETETSEVYARGHVVFDRGGRTWAGEEVHYNFDTQQGDFGEFSAEFDPYYVHAEDSERVSSNEFHLYKLRMSTCKPGDSEYSFRAREGRLIDNHILKVKHFGVFLGPVPIFYLPWAKRDFDDRDTGIDVTPGYSGKMGAFLLSSYNYNVTPVTKGRTHLDYRSKRGVGVGQDFEWKSPDRDYAGRLRLYYLDDKEPFDSKEEELDRGDLISSERYRARLSHNQKMSDRTYLITELNYLSDPDVLEDFFDGEFRRNSQPENRVSLLHREDDYTVGAEVTKRLNDFYESVDRTPELTLDISRQEVGSSGFYYESDNSLARLARVFPEGSGIEDYDSLRLDTHHVFIYPTRHFGFLNFIPQAGVRGTYYSDTPLATENEVLSPLTDTNGVVIGTETNIEITVASGGAEFRSLFELGFETSFKSFKEISPNQNRFGRGLRHVVEPYAQYTYVPTPSVEPADLYQFDDIDALDKFHQIRLGVRNKFQTKKQKQIRDLLDLDVHTDYRLDPAEGEDDFSTLDVDAEFRFVDWYSLDVDGRYNFYDTNIEEFNAQMYLESRAGSTAGLEYRFIDERRDQIAFSTELFPEEKWTYRAYWRYDLDGNDIEEHRYEIDHKMDCLGWGVGWKEVDNDITVWAQLWILALPRAHLDLGR